VTATWNNKFHVAAPQSKFQGCLTPDEAAYHRNASQGRLWGGLLGRGSGLWPANTASAAFSGMMLLRLRPSESSIMPENAKQTPSESFQTNMDTAEPIGASAAASRGPNRV